MGFGGGDEFGDSYSVSQLIGKYTQYECDQCGTYDESCLECFEHWKSHYCWSEEEEEVEEVVVVE